MNEVIYYKFKKGFWCWLWLIFDVAALALLFKCLCCPVRLYTWQILALLIVVAAHLGVWLYKFAADNEMAVISDKDIKIDHNNPIAWKDIAYAEEKMVRCCGKDRKILSLVPHDGIDYKYSWLQLHNAGFTAFSIPLYGIISKEDEEKIIKIIEKKVGIKTLKEETKSEPKKEPKKAASKPAKKSASAKKAAPKSKAKK